MQQPTPELAIDGKYIKLVLQGNRVDQHPYLLTALQNTYNYDFENPPVHVPYETYVAMLDYIRVNLHGKLSEDEGFMELGKGMIRGFRKTEMGQVLTTTAQVNAPEVALKTIIRMVFAVSRRITQSPIEELRKGYCRYRVREIRVPPAYISGILYAAMSNGKVQNLKITYERIESTDVIFTITWEEV